MEQKGRNPIDKLLEELGSIFKPEPIYINNIPETGSVMYSGILALLGDIGVDEEMANKLTKLSMWATMDITKTLRNGKVNMLDYTFGVIGTLRLFLRDESVSHHIMPAIDMLTEKMNNDVKSKIDMMKATGIDINEMAREMGLNPKEK